MRHLIGFLLLTVPGAAWAQAATPPAKPAPCTDANHHAFDFWVGRWDVHPFPGGPLVAHSLIESLYGGCAVRENWMPLKGGGGGSLNIYDSRDGKWHQSWVDSGGTRASFTGGIQGDAMVLSGEWAGSGPKGEDGITRMTYSRQAGGAVRQRGEFSADGGKTWVATFDLLYTPAKPA